MASKTLAIFPLLLLVLFSFAFISSVAAARATPENPQTKGIKGGEVHVGDEPNAQYGYINPPVIGRPPVVCNPGSGRPYTGPCIPPRIPRYPPHPCNPYYRHCPLPVSKP